MINWDIVVSVMVGIGIYKLIETLLRLMSAILFGGRGDRMTKYIILTEDECYDLYMDRPVSYKNRDGMSCVLCSEEFFKENIVEEKKERKSKMKKLFISVPMKGRTGEAIRNSIAKMKKIAEAYEGEELELIYSYVEDNPPKDGHTAIWYLSKSLEKLANADVFITIDEAYEWNGCFIEWETARRYGIKTYKVDCHIVMEDYKEICDKRYNTPAVCCEA